VDDYAVLDHSAMNHTSLLLLPFMSVVYRMADGSGTVIEVVCASIQ